MVTMQIESWHKTKVSLVVILLLAIAAKAYCAKSVVYRLPMLVWMLEALKKFI